MVPVLCGHYLRVGFDHLDFVDDGSTDGTFEALSEIGARTSKVAVRRNPLGVFDQRALVNEMANRLIGEGYRFVFPFDCDEFWLVDMRELADRLGPSPGDCVFRGCWINFVQMRHCRVSTTAALDEVRYRVDVADAAGMDDVMRMRRGFVSSQQEKSAVCSTQAVAFSKGQHGLSKGPEAAHPRPFPILHIPLRSAAEITRRGRDYEPRRAHARTSLDESWQSRFFADAVRTGLGEKVWKANSANRRGELDLPGGPHRLVRDETFRLTVALALRHLEAVTGLKAG
jgi:glycosyltransferase involved in cell wall biosynthesis